MQLVDEDEQKNEKLRYEFRNYNYKGLYSNGFEVKIRQKGSYNAIYCKNYSSFKDALIQGLLKNIDQLKVTMKLCYKKGSYNALNEYDNFFEISFEPYNIKFIRKSNHNELYMNYIEENVNQILNKFQKINTIFCTK